MNPIQTLFKDAAQEWRPYGKLAKRACKAVRQEWPLITASIFVPAILAVTYAASKPNCEGNAPPVGVGNPEFRCGLHPK